MHAGFDPWDVSQQGLADLLKSEQHQNNQQQQYNPLSQSSIGLGSADGSLSNGVSNGEKKSTLLQEEFKALFPNVNVSFEGKVY